MKTLAGLALLAAAVLGGYFLWTASGEMSPERGTGGLRPSDAGPAPERVQVDRSSPDLVPATAVVPEEPQGPPSTRTAVEPEVEKDDGEGLSLLVVDDADGAPVAGAEVFLLDPDEVDRALWVSRIQDMPDPVALARELGSRALTDARGRARHAWGGSGGLVAAQAGERATFAFLKPDHEGTLTLRLESRARIEVRVVDANGQPVLDVPVLLRAHVEGGADFDYQKALTQGPDAAVVFLDPGKSIEVDGEVPSFRVSLGVPGVLKRERRVDFKRPRDEPLVLRLGKTAPLVVTVVNEEGEVLDVTGQVEVLRQGTIRALTANLEHGQAVLAHVGLKGALTVVASLPGRGLTLRTETPGPAEAGVALAVRLTARPRPYVTGRLLDSNGTAVGSGPYHLYFWSGKPNDPEWVEVQTDERGAFRVDLDSSIDPGTGLRVALTDPTFVPEPRRADSAEVLVQAEVTDVGDLRFKPSSRIAGRCMDTAGEPVAGVEVLASTDLGGFLVPAESNEQGRFEIRGLFAEFSQLTVVSETWILPEVVVSAPRDGEVELVLVRPGKVVGSVDLRTGMDPSSVRVSLESKAKSSGVRPFVQPDAEGRFEVTGLAPGRYTCEFSLGSQQRASVDDVIVAEAQVTEDPRLQAVDLVTGVATLVLEVSRSDGRPMADVSAAIVREGRLFDRRWRRAGDLSFTWRIQPGDLAVVSSSGCRSVVVEATDGIRRVVLDPGLEVTLRSSTRPNLSEGDRSASLSLGGSFDERLLYDAGFVDITSLARDGELRAVFPGPGTYRLWVSVHQPTSDGAMMASVPTEEDLAAAPTLEIRESDAGGVLTFDLPAELF